MSLVKAKCLKCNEEIEVESEEEAGNCPKCGTAFITAKVIKNYQLEQEPQTKPKKIFEGFDEYVEKYNAFVSLYDIDFNAILSVYQMQVQINESDRKTEASILQYNEAVQKVERKRDSYDNKVDGFNAAKYTAGADSWTEKLHTKYLDNAHKKYEESQKEVYLMKDKVNENKIVTENLRSQKNSLEESVRREVFAYSLQAFSVVEEMCQKYPSNPLSYLYKADWYKREAESEKKFYNYVEGKYPAETELLSLIQKDIDLHGYKQKANAEMKKADKFMTEEFREENAEVIKSLTGSKPTKLQSTAKTKSLASTKKSTSSSSKTPSKGLQKINTSSSSKAKSAKSKPVTPKKILTPKEIVKEEKRLQRKRKLHRFVVDSVIGIIFVAVVAVLLMKYAFKLF